MMAASARFTTLSWLRHACAGIAPITGAAAESVAQRSDLEHQIEGPLDRKSVV
jgi:hypothetical protein